MLRRLSSALSLLRSLDPRVRRQGKVFGDRLPPMQYRQLRGGLRSSVMALGGGGYSRLGQASGRSERQSLALVQRAYQLGINHFDSCSRYRTSHLFGRALAGVPRDSYLLSSKIPWAGPEGQVDADHFRHCFHNELRYLDTGYVDILSVHAVPAEGYEEIVAELYPVMQDLRDQGKARLLGISEGFVSDPGHRMLQRAIQGDLWDMALIGFNLINQSAREKVVPKAQKSEVNLVGMFAVRRAMRSGRALLDNLRRLEKLGAVSGSRELFDTTTGLLASMGEGALQDVAYRFVRYEPGIDVTLFGTGNIDHLESNVQSMLKGPLPEEVVSALIDLFAQVEPVALN